MALESGTRLGPYEIAAAIGAGGMGEVYRARDTALHRDVAIKVLPDDVAGDVDRLARFGREAKALASLNHPNIAQIHGLETSGDTPAIVMELVEGPTLADRIKAGPIPLDEALPIARQIAEALEAAHERGIIHRDLKPANVKVKDDGTVKVLDFGLAKAFAPDGSSAAAEAAEAKTVTSPAMTQMGVILGTAAYMAPEQARGKPVDKRADIWAFGAVLFEMLTGRRAFDGTTVTDVLAAVVNSEPEWSLLPRDVPPGVRSLLRRTLQKAARQRLRDVGDARIELGDGTGAVHVPSSGDEWGGERAPWTRRFVFPAILVLLAAVAGWWLGHREEAPSAVEFLALDFSEPPRLRSIYTAGAKISPDGSRLAYFAHDGWHVIDLRTGEDSPASLQVSGLGLVFSPDGKSVALNTTSRMQQLFLADLTTGDTTELSEGASPTYWDRDGWVYHNVLSNWVRTRVRDGFQEVLGSQESETGKRHGHLRPVDDGRGFVYTHTHESGNPDLAEIRVLESGSEGGRRIFQGIEAYPIAGYLLILQADGRLLTAPFDEQRLSLQADPVLVLDDLQVTVGSGFLASGSFSVSDQGTAVYVARREMTEDLVVMVDRAGAPIRPGTTWGGWISAASFNLHQPVNQIERSADGARWIASVHPGREQPHIYVRRDGEFQARRLTFFETLTFYPRFIPRSLDVAFVALTPTKNWDLYRVPFDGGQRPVPVLDRPGDIQNPRFSSDGRWVVFCERDETGQVGIFAHDLAGDSGTIPIVTEPTYACSPDISPSGRWLVYESIQDGRAEVYVQGFPSSSGAPWQLTSDGLARPSLTGGGGRLPHWSERGDEIFYLSANSEVMAMPVVDGERFRHDAPRVLFALDPDTSWTSESLPDGQGFILIRRDMKAPGQVMMVRNFFELLRQKVGQ